MYKYMFYYSVILVKELGDKQADGIIVSSRCTTLFNTITVVKKNKKEGW